MSLDHLARLTAEYTRRLTASMGKHGGDDSRYPHKCPQCGLRAYVGLNRVWCRGVGCKNFDWSE